MHAVLGDRPEHYRTLNLRPNVVEPWEDGLRTSAAEGSFEWWYLDCHLRDGSKLAITFYTKPPQVSASRPLTPLVTLLWDRADGRRVERIVLCPPEEFQASRASCDVRMGACTFVGDLGRYRVHFVADGAQADLTIDATLPAWRPATGHAFFGEDEQRHVAWLAAVPHGKMHGTVTIDGQSEAIDGDAYHDHNWGNVSLRKVIDHWYWGRAHVGEYTALTLMLLSNAAYGSRELGAFMLAHQGQILASDESKLRFSGRDISTTAAGIPVASRLCFEFDDGTQRHAITFLRRKDVLTLDFGHAGAYVRFSGDVALRADCGGGVVVERRATDATWELLAFRG